MYVARVVAALQPFESKLEFTQFGMHYRETMQTSGWDRESRPIA